MPSPHAREWKAFVAVPLFATLAWYLLMLGTLVIANGRLRFRTDVVAMAIGAVLIALPVMIVVTAALAVPTYLLLRRTIGITIGGTMAAGGIIGFAIGLAVWTLTDEHTMLSPSRGMLIGVAAAAGWWSRSRACTPA
jgi:hypothetical protein